MPITRIGQSYLFVGRSLRVFFKGKVGETREKDKERHHHRALRARIHDCGAEYLGISNLRCMRYKLTSFLRSYNYVYTEQSSLNYPSLVRDQQF